MQDTIVTIYCLCDDLLKALSYRDDRQSRYSGAEVMTVPLIAASFFGGNQAFTRQFLYTHGYTRHTLSASRFCRRLQALPQSVWNLLFSLLAEVFQQTNQDQVYVVDSLPVPVCHNIRIKRCRLFPLEKHPKMRGYTASKHTYFYGLKVHLLISSRGEPLEFTLSDGAVADIEGFKSLPLDLPEGALIHADKAYWDRQEEQLLLDAGAIIFQPLRRDNAKDPLPQSKVFLAQPVRQRIETTFSQLTALFPKRIHAVTAAGFIFKLNCFLLAYSLSCLVS